MQLLKKYILSVILWGIPPAMLAYLLGRFAVDLPFMDQWELAPMIAGGVGDSRGIYTQINEFLQFVPNGIFLALARITNWDTRAEMWLIFASVLCSFLLVTACMVRVMPSGAWRRRWYPLVVSVVLFSLMQYENWFQGIQLSYTLPALALVWGLCVALYCPSLNVAIINALVVAVVASFSCPNGVILWILLPLGGVFLRRDLRRKHALVWVGCAVGFGVLYARLYSLGALSPTPPSYAPLRVFGHFLIILGNPLAISAWWPDAGVAVILAAASGILLLLLSVVLCVLHRRDRHLLGLVVPLALYGVGTAFLVAVGRASFGLEQALSPRYTTFSVWLPVAIVILLSCTKRWHGGIAVGLIAGIVMVSDVGYLGEVRKLAFTRRQGRACLSFIKSAPHRWCLDKLVYPDATKLSDRAQLLSRNGFLHPPVLTEEDTRRVVREAVRDREFYGYLDGVTVGESGVVTATGWGWLAHRGEIADAVLMTLQPDGGDEVVFHLEIVTDKRPATEWIRGFKKVIEDGSFAQISQWRSILPTERMPCGKVTLRAYSYDVRDGRAYQQRGDFVGEARKCDG